MKDSGDPLQRLFRAAASANKTSPISPPLALDNRVLSQWRDAADEGEFAALASLFRRAVACAACIMVLSIGWGWMQSRADNSGETALANYALNIQLPP
jgi:hypothetical protein